jgi:hypothetical protein
MKGQMTTKATKFTEGSERNRLRALGVLGGETSERMPFVCLVFFVAKGLK